MKYCEKCGNQLLDEAVICPKCGCAVAGKQPSKQQDEYAKKQAKGAVMIIAAIAIVVFVIMELLLGGM